MPSADQEALEQNKEIIQRLSRSKTIDEQDFISFLQRNQIEWTRTVSYQNVSINLGNLASQLGHENIYEALVSYGAQTELLLSMLGQRIVEDGTLVQEDNDEEKVVSNKGYLERKLEFTQDKDGGERLIDSDQNGVMMGWEDPLMRLHASVITKGNSPGLRVLNVGFGLGLVDTYLQSTNPAKHTIIEAHPDVYRKMIQDGWDKKATILFGRWQDVIPDLEVYDGIFFDTFGEYLDDMKEFHELLPNILDEDGVYSFFNGLAGTDKYLHDVACRLAELELVDMGLHVEWKQLEMDKLGDNVWQGIKREYFSLPIYNLPTVTFDL